MRRFIRWILKALWRATEPRRPDRRPATVQARPRSIPLPAGTPRHTTVKLATEPRPIPKSPSPLPGSTPPKVRRS